MFEFLVIDFAGINKTVRQNLPELLTCQSLRVRKLTLSQSEN